jgi:hypothetical protein
VGERWTVHAAEDACDIAMRAPGAGRVAADEVFVAGGLADDLRAAIEKVDPNAIVRDARDGWDEVVLAPSDAGGLWPHLFEHPLPDAPGYFQGAVDGVPVRVIVEDDAVRLFVRPPVTHHLRARIDQEHR